MPSNTGFFSFKGPTSPVRGVSAQDSNPGPMDDEEFSAAVRHSLADAVDYVDGFLADQRATATAYYRGDFFGNEEKGRSQVVMTEVRDTVLAQMPSLLRIFCGSEKAVSYEPRTADKVEMAEQATDAINYIFHNDNDGFTILYNAMKDALVRKSGVLKWRWNEDIEVKEYEFTGLSDAQMQLLVVQPDAEIIEHDAQPVPGWQPPMDPTTGMPVPIQQPMLHACKLRVSKKKGRALVECVPVEELLVSRTSRDLDTSPLIAHRCLKTYSELRSMGYSTEQLDSMSSGVGDTFMWNVEAQTRNPALNAMMQMPDGADASSTKVVYNECYIRIDRDGDGIAELRKVCIVGTTVLHDEVWDSVPVAILCPDPEPHMLIGNSVADQTMDLQLLMSNIVRNTLDSLAQSIHPRTAVVENQVNMDDVLNTESGAIVRCRAPGMIQELTTTFVGQQALPIIAWLNEVKAKRTGVVPASAGLDPDVLQSTTKTGVDATVQGAQERTEMIARLFAEGGIKRMMRGLLKLVCQHQDQPRMMRLRGKFVECDPRTWDADMDVIVHVALGRGTDQDRLLGLAGIISKQELAIQNMGPANPIADLANLRNSYAKSCEILGFKNVEEFFKPIDMQQLQQQMAQEPPKPDPNMMVAEAQQQKVQADIQVKQAQLQLEAQQLQFEQMKFQLEGQFKQQQAQMEMQMRRFEAQMEDARKREEMRLNAVLKSQGQELQYGTQVSASQAQAELQRAGLLAGAIKEDNDRRADVTKHAMTIEQKDRQAELMAQAKRDQGNGTNTDS